MYTMLPGVFLVVFLYYIYPLGRRARGCLDKRLHWAAFSAACLASISVPATSPICAWSSESYDRPEKKKQCHVYDRWEA